MGDFIMKKFKNFIKILIHTYLIDSFYLTFPPVVGILISLATLPIILANLPVNDYGTFQFVLALQIWLITISGKNITAGAKRGIARGLNGTFLLAFFSRLKLLVAIGLISCGISFFIYNFGLTTLALLLLIVSIFLILGYPFQISYITFFVAKKQFKIMVIWQVITLSIVPIVSALTAFFTHNIIKFAIIQLGVTALIGWLGWGWVVKKNKLIFAYKKREIDKECVSYGLKLVPADLITVTAAKISHFIIGPFLGFENLALFSVANNLRNKFAGFMKQARPLLYSDFAKNDKDKLINTLKSKIKYIVIVSFIISLACITAGYLYIKLFLPTSYQTAIIYFFILSLGLPVIIFQIIMHTILETNFRYKELMALAILPNLIKIVLILGLGVAFKIIGICWGIVIGGWLNFILYYVLTLRREKVVKFLNNHPLVRKVIARY